MKGDLSTLKKVCKYASVVMLIGEIVFAALVLITVALGIASLFSDPGKDMFIQWIGSKSMDGTLTLVSSFLVTTLLFVMGFITVHVVYGLMVALMTEYSPFIPENAKRMKTVSMTYLFSSVFILVFGYLGDKGITELLFLFFASLMISVVMYCLTIICRYGVLLQKESDQTL